MNYAWGQWQRSKKLIKSEQLLTPPSLVSITTSGPIWTRKLLAPFCLTSWLPEPSLEGSHFTPVKSEVSKAHRSINLTRRRWRYMIAAVKVLGKYGGHLWCGLCPALPGKDGSSCDMPCLPPHAGTSLDLRLRGRLLLGVENRWLGYMVGISKLTVWLPEDKTTVLLQALDKLAEGELHTRKEITVLLGRLQWVAKANLQICPRLPWEQKIQRKCRPGALVRFQAKLVTGLMNAGPCAMLCNCWLDPILQRAKAQRRFAALKMLGASILFIFSPVSIMDMNIPSASPTRGMLSWQSRDLRSVGRVQPGWWSSLHRSMPWAPSLCSPHVKRCSNTWADQLTHFDFTGFNEDLRLGTCSDWRPG